VSTHPFVAKARQRANQLVALTDPQFAEAYRATLKDSNNLHFSPYLVTAIREIDGMWERLALALGAAEAQA
jgi:hypothetical protein